MNRRIGVLLAAAALAATAALSAQAAPTAAVGFSFLLGLRTGTYAAAPPPVMDVSFQGVDVIAGGKSIALPQPVEAVAASPHGHLVAAETWNTSGCGSPPPPLCGVFSIWVMNRDGSDLRLFSRDAADPAWSPDSRRLAFVGHFDTPSLTGIVSVANVDGTHRRALGVREAAARPTWAPSGALLAYTRTTGRRSIRIVRVADARVVAVLHRAGDPTWARSGRRLAFVRPIGVREALMLWSSGRSRRLATAQNIEALSWSPGGRRIAFARAGAAAVVGFARVDRTGARSFRLPASDARNGAHITEILWKDGDDLLVTGRLYGILPR